MYKNKQVVNYFSKLYNIKNEHGRVIKNKRRDRKRIFKSF